MAENDCVGKNAHLASIHSKQENDFLWNLANKKVVWIGAKKIESSFQWLDGTAFDFQYWSRGQPDNYKRQEHCIDNGHAGQWNDRSCKYKNPYVCKTTLPGTFIKLGKYFQYT